MLKEEFNPNDGVWFDDKEVYVDLGFLGIQKDYCETVQIPYKKPKGKELTKKAKLANKEKSKDRIYVEHSIGGMKRYKILSEKSRIKSVYKYNQITGVCAGLWNFYLNH